MRRRLTRHVVHRKTTVTQCIMRATYKPKKWQIIKVTNVVGVLAPLARPNIHIHEAAANEVKRGDGENSEH